ncbi:ATP-dependent DNA helicase RecG [Jatrophihabitans sp. YIM 134969]
MSDDVLDRPLVEVVKPPRKYKNMLDVLRKAFGIETVGDLVNHLPRRLQDRGEISDLGALQQGEQVTVIARVESVSTRRMRQKRGFITEVRITDGRTRLSLTWFSAPWVDKQLRVGVHAMFAGKVSLYQGKPQLTFPQYAVLGDDVELDDDGTVDLSNAASSSVAHQLSRPLLPIYPSAQNLPSWAIGAAVGDALAVVEREGVTDPLDERLRRGEGLVGLLDAWRGLHQPVTRSDWVRGRERLAFDEALDIQLVLARRRHAARAEPATARPRRPGGLLDALDARLPFELTAGQREIGEVIAGELGDRWPMQRLLQGEVGSGKTVVALRAMLQVVDAGGQAVLLAPTEVLAQQHARSLTAMLGPMAERGLLGGADQGTRVTLLTGSLGAKARRAALLEAASGEAGIVVGTHALLEERVQFADLGLVVVDEQHRFGVEQRDALRERSGHPPHVLVMTATPIPRTVAMTVFGDLEVSVLRERPAGRAPVTTTVVPVANEAWFARTWSRLREEVAAGRQAFVVFPRVGGDEPDDDLEPVVDVEDDELDLDDLAPTPPERRPAGAVLELGAELAADELAGLRTATLYGKLPPEEKDSTMTAFAAGDLDVLLATTVIEVGVDVPNASVMVIVDADRFGVSQLHQLRGRIGRGGHAGVCLLLTRAETGSPGRTRLDAVAASDDGFVLAEADLEARREGDVLGAAQSGRRRSLRLLSLRHDRKVIARAREIAGQMVDADPKLGENPALKRRVEALEALERAEFLAKS